MNWDKGYEASFYATIVDPATWNDIGSFDFVTGSVLVTDSGIRRSADITCRNYDTEYERMIRLYLIARQGSDTERHALFTGFAASPEAEEYHLRTVNSVKCYSPLEATKIPLKRGWCAKKGFSGAELIEELLSVCGAPINTAEGSPRLKDHIVAEGNETRLSMADKIASAIGWRIKMHGDGSIDIMETAETESATLGYLENDIVKLPIKRKHDMFACPNVLTVESNGEVAEARDDDPMSPLSTVRRGREVPAEESTTDLNDNETLQHYAVRRLKELQSSAVTASYTRRFVPDIETSDIIRLNYPAQNTSGLYRITSQKIQLAHAAMLEEEATRL